MTEEQIDEAKAEAVAGRLLENLSSASLALMASIGHRTGLFDTVAGLFASTSHQKALPANLVA